MSAVIDEAAAWELVRAMPPGQAALEGRARVTHPTAAEPWLELEASGRWTASAPCGDAARDLFDLYLPLQVPADLVIAQMGQSLDGRIATETGHSFYVTGADDITRLHRLRALVDAVVIGADTAIHDSPRLTVRKVPGDDPVRVVLDPDRRVDPGNRVFTQGTGRTLLVCRPGGGAGRGSTPAPADVIELATVDPVGFDPRAVLARLRERGLRRVLVEGGGVTVSRFLQAGALDRLHVTVAPLLLGSGRPALVLDPIETLDQALRPRCRRFDLGDDVLFDLELGRGPGDVGPSSR